MKNMGMKSLKRILLATFIIFSVMTINVNSATTSRIGDAVDNKATIDFATITGIYNIDYLFAYPVRDVRYTSLESVVDGTCNGNQMNPCGIVINYNIISS